MDNQQLQSNNSYIEINNAINFLLTNILVYRYGISGNVKCVLSLSLSANIYTVVYHYGLSANTYTVFYRVVVVNILRDLSIRHDVFYCNEGKRLYPYIARRKRIHRTAKII